MVRFVSRSGYHPPMSKDTHITGPVRLLFDPVTSEWFWVHSDDQGQLVFSDSNSYGSEGSAREAAAADQGVDVTELVHAGANPTDEELDAETA